jgi:DNA-directed RNA polymerase specialized sigma24 family protein
VRRTDGVRYAGQVTDPELWRLLHAVAATGDAAWPALVAVLEPVLVEMARHQPIGRLRDAEDSPREIVTAVLVRLHKRDYHAIRTLCGIQPTPELRAWLRVLVKRSAIDYMRGSPEYRRGTSGDGRWITLATLSSRELASHPDTLAEKRALVLAFMRETVERGTAEAREHGSDEAISRLALAWKVDRTHVRRLMTRGQQYLNVLSAVLEGHSYNETAAQLKITRREVELTVRYIEDLLEARRFAAPGPAPVG